MTVVQHRINYAQCSNCNTSFSKQKVEFAERPAGNDFEVGIICQNCGHWFHSFFLNKELKEMQKAMAQVSNRKIRREYKTKFDKFNKRKRKLMGMRKVNGRWVNDSLQSHANSSS